VKNASLFVQYLLYFISLSPASRAMSPRPCLRRESAQEIDDSELIPLQQQQQQQFRNNKSLSLFPNSTRKSLSPSPQHRSNFLSPAASFYKSAPGKPSLTLILTADG
jgi:hypothetical protein